MPRSTATPTAREQLAALDAERERILVDLGNARERHKALRAQRVEALGGTPDTRAARALDSDITSCRHDIDTLEELLEDMQPRRQEMQRNVADADRVVSERAAAERDAALARDELEIAGHMAAIKVIADRQGDFYLMSTPFSPSASAICKLARSSRWTTWHPEQTADRLARAERTLAELDGRA